MTRTESSLCRRHFRYKTMRFFLIAGSSWTRTRPQTPYPLSIYVFVSIRRKVDEYYNLPASTTIRRLSWRLSPDPPSSAMALGPQARLLDYNYRYGLLTGAVSCQLYWCSLFTYYRPCNYSYSCWNKIECISKWENCNCSNRVFLLKHKSHCVVVRKSL